MTTVAPFEPTILRHPRMPLAAHVSPLGLNVTKLIFADPTTGAEHDVIVGPEDPADHWNKGRTFLGPIIGRYANRLPAGKQSYDGGQLDIAEFSAPGVALHGGPEMIKEVPRVPQEELVLQEGPLDRLVWTRLSSSRSQFFGIESPSTPSGSSALFALLNKGVEAGQQGYPGTIRIEVRLAIEASSQPATQNGMQNGTQDGPSGPDAVPDLGRSAGTLRMEYRAALVDGDACEATPLNMTHHWSFNLSASDASARAQENGTIDWHTLRMFPPPSLGKSTKKLYTLGLDKKMVPTGELIDCQGTPHDWLAGGSDGLGKTIIHDGSLQGYDHFYAWRAPDRQAAQSMHPIEYHARFFSQPRLVLHAPSTKLSLAFRSNQAGVQVYTTNGQPPAPAPADRSGGAKKRLHASSGEENDGIAQRSGVALEFGQPHGTFLHKAYQELAQDDTILRKGQQYRNWIEVELFKQL